VPHLNFTGRETPGQDEPPLLLNNKPDQDESPWLVKDAPPILVNYKWLEAAGVFSNRMDCHRKRLEGFPAPLQLSENKIAWKWSEVQEWLASRPRRMPGTKKTVGAPEAAIAP
jgi:hypothetical protein